MKYNKWFSETFLKSIFDTYVKRGNIPMWLTQKQTYICTEYMEVVNRRFSDMIGSYNHKDYHYEKWTNPETKKQYEVWLSFSKLNGCGRIEFVYILTAEEQLNRKTLFEINEILNNFITYHRASEKRWSDRNEARYNKYMDKLQDCICESLEDIAEAQDENTEFTMTEEEMIQERQWIAANRKRREIAKKLKREIIGEKEPDLIIRLAEIHP